MKLINDDYIKLIVLKIAEDEQIINLKEFLNNVITTKYEKSYSVTEIGQIIGSDFSAQKINKILETHGYQKKENNKWIPTDKSEDLIYTAPSVIIKNEDTYVVKLDIRWKKDIIFVLQSILNNKIELKTDAVA